MPKVIVPNDGPVLWDWVLGGPNQRNHGAKVPFPRNRRDAGRNQCLYVV